MDDGCVVIVDFIGGLMEAENAGGFKLIEGVTGSTGFVGSVGWEDGQVISGKGAECDVVTAFTGCVDTEEALTETWTETQSLYLGQTGKSSQRPCGRIENNQYAYVPVEIIGAIVQKCNKRKWDGKCDIPPVPVRNVKATFIL